ncbi:MAG: hypothetical protein K0S32_3557 [Bacteroidetes bacterium]|jgi:hypothetical protein|nr:hypothetical protein [Bacteroidota bacterium]
MIGTIYSHYNDFDKVCKIAEKHFPNSKFSFDFQEESQFLTIEIKGGFFKSTKKLAITYRERKEPSYQLPQVDDSPLTANLKGMYGFVSSLPAKNTEVQGMLMRKILTMNCEFSLTQEAGEIPEAKKFAEELAKELDAFLFVSPESILSKSDTQHFLDKNLNLILDTKGDSGISNLEIHIESKHFDKNQDQITEDQKQRKNRSESFLEKRNIKTNKNLPCVESEANTTIRSPKEIAQRVTVLAVTNGVAFNHLSGQEATDYLKKHKLWDFITPNEKDFLSDPTDEKKNYETWKCEDIWTLMWALNKVPELGLPDEMCSLDNIPPEEYPIGGGKDPNTFINSFSASRSKSEILDANDLYYRINWACTDARIKNQEMNEAHPGVVYERHYALNWLVNYMGQDWDDVSCDT